MFLVAVRAFGILIYFKIVFNLVNDEKCSACGSAFGKGERCEKCGLPRSKLGAAPPKGGIVVKKRDPINTFAAFAIAAFVLVGCSASVWIVSIMSNDNPGLGLSVDAPEDGVYRINVSLMKNALETSKLTYELKGSGIVVESGILTYVNPLGNVTFHDANSDKKLSQGDYFLVRGVRATPPGIAEPEDEFVIFNDGVRLGGIFLP